MPGFILPISPGWRRTAKFATLAGIMEFIGEYRFCASAEDVWIALNDCEVLMQTIPGCTAMVRVTETDYAGRVAVKLGPMTAGFDGKIVLSELDPPFRYRISVEAHAAIAGTAAGSAQVRLIDIEGGSILYYDATTAIGGRLAAIGLKLVHGTATRYADKFFARFAKAMEDRAAKALTAPL